MTGRRVGKGRTQVGGCVGERETQRESDVDGGTKIAL